MNILITLTLFWIILSDQNSSFFVGFCLVSVFLIYICDLKLFTFSFIKLSRNFVLNTLRLGYEILKSSLFVAKLIWFDKKIIGKTKYYPLESKEPIEQAFQANKITLTPGTMSLKISNSKVLVHYIEESND